MATKSTKVYLENLTAYPTNFTGQHGKFQLAPNGTEDHDRSSIALVDEDLANEPFVQRAISRGRLAIISATEAKEKIATLAEAHEHENDLDPYLDYGADHITDHFKKDLPDEAWATGPGWTKDEILKGKKTAAHGTLSVDPEERRPIRPDDSRSQQTYKATILPAD
jgi:hypothetical protein